jgi:hypothetical protein
MHVECVAEHGASRDVVGSKGDDWVGQIWRGGEGTGAAGRGSAAGQTGARGGVRRAAFLGLAGILLLGAPPRPLSRMGTGHGRARGTTLQLACRCAQSAAFYACAPPRLTDACHFNVCYISSFRCLAFSEWGRFPNRTPLRTAKRTAKLLPRAHGALAGRAGCGGGALASNHTGSNASAVPVPSGPCGIPPHSCATYEAPADLAAIITSIPANVRALPPPCLAPPRAARRRAVERAGVCGCAPGARGDGPWPVRVRPHGPGLGPSVLHVSGRCR